MCDQIVTTCGHEFKPKCVQHPFNRLSFRLRLSFRFSPSSPVEHPFSFPQQGQVWRHDCSSSLVLQPSSWLRCLERCGNKHGTTSLSRMVLPAQVGRPGKISRSTSL